MDGESAALVLLRRLLLASAPPCRFRARFAGCRSLWSVPAAWSSRSLLVRSGAAFEFWLPGALCGFPVRSTLRQLKSARSSSNLSRWLLSGFLPPTAGRSFIGGTSACAGPLWRGTAISLAFGLATAVFRCGGRFTRGYGWSPVFPSFRSGGRRLLVYPWCFVHRPEFISGQSWPLLDFPLCGFSAGLCRSSLASPFRCLSEYVPSFYQLVSPRCGCV